MRNLRDKRVVSGRILGAKFLLMALLVLVISYVGRVRSVKKFGPLRWSSG